MVERLISSVQNQQIKELKKLFTRKGRKKAGQYLLEGPHLVEMAVKADAEIQMIYYVPESSHQNVMQVQALKTDLPLTQVTPEVAKALSQTDHHQDIFAVASIPQAKSLDIDHLSKGLLILDQVQDPGNLGTLIRTADAFGYQDVLLGLGTVDLYNDKVLRSMQGSHFAVNTYEVDLLEVIPQLQEAGYFITTTELNNQAKASNAFDLKSKGKWALVMGNEGNGVSQTTSQLADAALYIPMSGSAESLNVAVAGAIVMYQFPIQD
ncbi:TrmH family RNA methyltransferase [Aerococcus urinaeequi]|uniref:TrmH family RNA methyltransferase n=1 Tax=Aerococcus urinaeequi TaxID=51665 RepID=UPI003D6C647F